MDPDVARELEEHFKNLSDTLSKVSSNMTNSVNSTQNQTRAQSDNARATANATTGTNKLTEAQAKATSQQQQAMQQMQRLGGALDGLVSTVGSFGSAMMSAQNGMSKYGGAVNKLADTVSDLTKDHGMLGAAIGATAQVMSKLANDAMGLADNIIDFRDGLAKTAGALPITTTQLTELGKAAGYNFQNMEKLSRITAGLGTNLITMGASAGDGATKFMKMAAVSDETRAKFSKLGLKSEELTDMQAKYIEMQSVSGNSMELQSKSVKTLQKESLAYAESLIKLTGLTGKQADQIQKEQETVKLQIQEQLAEARAREHINQLRRSGNTSEANNLQEQEKQRKLYMDQVTGMFGVDFGLRAARAAREGVPDEYTSGLAISMPGIFNVRKQLQNGASGADLASNTIQGYTNSVGRMASGLGRTTDFLDEGTLNSLGLYSDAVLQANKLSGMSYEDRKKAENSAFNARANSTGTNDPLGQATADIVNAEKRLQATYETFLQSNVLPKVTDGLDYFATHMADMFEGTAKSTDKLTHAAEAAAIALFGLSAISTVSSVAGGARMLGLGAGGIGSGMTLAGATSIAGKLIKVGAGAGIGLAGVAGDYASDYAKAHGHQQAGAWGSLGSHALEGAGMGAAIGSVVPILGTTAGGIAGGILGGAYGAYDNWGGLWGGSSGSSPVARAKQQTTQSQMLLEHTKQLQAFGASKQAKNNQDQDRLNRQIQSTSQRQKEIADDQEDSNKLHNKNLNEYVLTVDKANKNLLVFTGLIQELNTALGGDRSNPQNTSSTGNASTDSILAAIRQHESGGDYTINNKTSSASGAYQFTDSTWQSLTKKYGIGTQYKHAANAPASIQDQVANARVSDILKASGGNIDAVAKTWFTGNAEGKSSVVSQQQVNDYVNYIRKNAGMANGTSGGLIGAVNSTTNAFNNMTDVSKFINFGGESGQQSNFDNLNPAVKSALLGAAQDYYSATGKKLTLNSGWRTFQKQTQLYNDYISGRSRFPAARPGTSHHEAGTAVDIAQGIAGDSRAIDILNKHGLFQTVKNDLPHFELKAAKGGVFTGPKSGYPVELHGTEIVAPLVQNSMLMKLAKTPEQTYNSSSSTGTDNDKLLKALVDVGHTNNRTLEYKLDQVIDLLSAGNDHTKKIARKVN